MKYFFSFFCSRFKNKLLFIIIFENKKIIKINDESKANEKTPNKLIHTLKLSGAINN
jgi:hypothetical protein